MNGSASGSGGHPNILNTTTSNGSPSIEIKFNEDYIGSPLSSSTTHNVLPCMTAPIGSLPTRQRKHAGSVDVLCSDQLDTTTATATNWGQYEIGTSSLIGMERNEMEFKIKNSSRDKLRNYVRDLFDQYHLAK